MEMFASVSETPTTSRGGQPHNKIQRGHSMSRGILKTTTMLTFMTSQKARHNLHSADPCPTISCACYRRDNREATLFENKKTLSRQHSDVCRVCSLLKMKDGHTL